MKKELHNGVEVTIYSATETKLVEFYEKNKNKPISEVAEEYKLKPYECRKWIGIGKRLKDA